MRNTFDNARSWLRYAEEDLDSASELSAGASTPRNVCWLSKHTPEKALKAAFVLEGMDFPYIHDLDRLRNSLLEGWPVKKTHPDLAWLTEYIIESEHPGDWPELPAPMRHMPCLWPVVYATRWAPSSDAAVSCRNHRV